MYNYQDDRGNYPILNISTEDFITECFKNKEELEKTIKFLSLQYENQRHYLTTYKIFDELFTDSLTVWANEDGVLDKITFNYEELVYKLQDLLHIKNKLDPSSPNLKAFLKDRINVLRNMRSSLLFGAEFPELDAIRKRGNEAPYRETKYYYSCGLRYVFSYFVALQADVLEHYVDNLDMIKEFCDSNNLFPKLKKDLDLEKTKLFLVNNMFEEMYNNDDCIYSNIYETIFNKYIRKDDDKSKVFTVDSNGMKRTYLEFVIRYNEYKDRGATVLDWELLKPGSKEYTNLFSSTKRERNEEDISKFVLLNDTKKEFYSKLPVVGMFKGVALNKGYKALILPNKEIILDKISDNDRFVKSYYGNSIYNLNIYNFERLSKLTKTALRNNHLCPFWYHDTKWQQEVSECVVNKETTQETYEETVKLVRKLSDKR